MCQYFSNQLTHSRLWSHSQACKPAICRRARLNNIRHYSEPKRKRIAANSLSDLLIPFPQSTPLVATPTLALYPTLTPTAHKRPTLSASKDRSYEGVWETWGPGPWNWGSTGGGPIHCWLIRLFKRGVCVVRSAWWWKHETRQKKVKMISLLVGPFLRAISRLFSGSPEDTCAATRSPPLTRRSPPVDKVVANFDKLPRNFVSLTLVHYQINGICTVTLVRKLEYVPYKVKHCRFSFLSLEEKWVDCTDWFSGLQGNRGTRGTPLIPNWLMAVSELVKLSVNRFSTC